LSVKRVVIEEQHLQPKQAAKLWGNSRVEAVVLQKDSSQEAQITNMGWHDPEQVIGGKFQYGDSTVSTTACDTEPIADVASIISRAQNPARIIYLRLKFQESQSINLVPSSFYQSQDTP